MSTDPRISVANSGILNIHKPGGVTSREVVNDIQRKIRRAAGQRIKCGHAGTLDPMATGVLLVCTGMATRLEPYLHEFSKTYRAGFTFGLTSDTDDCTGTIQQHDVKDVPERDSLLAALQNQTGSIMQRPPAFSALKVGGKRAYQLARAGSPPVFESRPALVHEITLERYEFPTAECMIRCASGTYIRSIARDVGEALGCGGLMHSLVRTEIGPFALSCALDPDSITSDNLKAHLQSSACAFPGVPSMEMDDIQQVQLRDGKSIAIAGATGERLIATDSRNTFVSLLARIKTGDNLYRPELNLAPIIYGP